MLKSATSFEEYEAAGEVFAEIPEYDDVQNRIKECQEKAEACRSSFYEVAKSQFQIAKSSQQYSEVAQLFGKIRNYRDAEQFMLEAKKKEEIASRTEVVKMERARKIAERKRTEQIKNKIKKGLVATVIIVLTTSLMLGYKYILRPMIIYRNAEKMLLNAQFDKALEGFNILAESGYKDSKERASDIYFSLAKESEKNGEILSAVLNYRKSGKIDTFHGQFAADWAITLQNHLGNREYHFRCTADIRLTLFYLSTPERLSVDKKRSTPDHPGYSAL